MTIMSTFKERLIEEQAQFFVGKEEIEPQQSEPNNYVSSDSNE